MILAEFSKGTVLCALEVVPYSDLKYLLIFHGKISVLYRRKSQAMHCLLNNLINGNLS